MRCAGISTRWRAADLPGLLEALPEGPLAASLPIQSGEAIGSVDGPHGLAWHWLRLEGRSPPPSSAIGLARPGRARARGAGRADREDAGIILAACGCSAAGVDL